MIFEDLGVMPYRDAWALQEAAHERVASGGEETVFFVEHPPVITLGRRAGLEAHIITPADVLQKMGIEVVHSDRGGDVTFHGPGQIVVYPIVRLLDHHWSVGGYVRALQNIAVNTLARFNIAGRLDPSAIGVWVMKPDGVEAKVCALGVRVRRGVTLHGIALNVVTDLRYFDLIVPCGLAGRAVTSLRQVMQEKTPAMGAVKAAFRDEIERTLASVRAPGISGER